MEFLDSKRDFFLHCRKIGISVKNEFRNIPRSLKVDGEGCWNQCHCSEKCPVQIPGMNMKVL